MPQPTLLQDSRRASRRRSVLASAYGIVSALALTLLLGLVSCAPAISPPQPPLPSTGQPQPPLSQPEASDRELPALDPHVLHGKLDNGLAYYVRANAKPEGRGELRLVVDVGSILEADDERGLAHFVEHMAFNGTEKYRRHELVDFVESIGMRFGADLNAFTSFNETVYALTVPTGDAETLDTALDILREWGQNLRFDPDEVESEKGVVLEEWRGGLGPGTRIRDQQLPLLFRGSLYPERQPIGDPKVIEQVDAEALSAFYRRWYRPDLMAVVAVGDFDPQAMVETIRSTFTGSWGMTDAPPRPQIEVPDHGETLFSVLTDPEITTSQVAVYTQRPAETRTTVADYRRRLVDLLRDSMLSFRLGEVARQPEPPYLWGRSNTLELVRGRRMEMNVAGVRDGEVASGLEALLLELERAGRHGFNASELDRTSRDLLRLYEQAFEERDRRDSGSLTSAYVDHFLTGDPSPGIDVELELLRSLLPTITLEEIRLAGRSTDSQAGRIFLVTGPEGAALPTRAELLATYERVQSTEVAPYVDDVPDQPLLAAKLAPGVVVAEHSVPELGLTLLELSNGVRIVLKPTDFQNDEILLTAFSPGGHSLAPDSDFASASLAADLTTLGGLGDFDRRTLDKVLAGTVAEAGAFIAELEEGITGSAAASDLETLLKLVYLRFTAPRKDPEAFASFTGRLRPLVEKRSVQPATAFEDEWTRRLTGDHPRRRPTTIETLDGLDLDTAIDFYRERFADAGDFTFVLVGNLALEITKPLIVQYLGALPTNGRKETWRDIGVERPKEPQTFEIRRGLEPKSKVRLAFFGETPWTTRTRRRAALLEDVIELRLREVLREEQGRTYGVGVSAGLSPYPDPVYTLEIGYGCAPDAVDETLATLWQELRRLKNEGLPPELLAKAKAATLRERETRLEQNTFWLVALRFYYRYDLDPLEIQTFDTLLDEDRYLLGILRPEDKPE